MDFNYLIKGVIIGFSIAAPVGPISVLCIRNALVKGFAVGLLSGLGAATADAIYGCIAGFGLTFISVFLTNQQIWLRLVGGLFLCFLGVKTVLNRPAKQADSVKDKGFAAVYISTLFLTLTNPMTVLSFAAIFSGLGIGNTNGDYAYAGILVLGVFIGSAMWWLILSGSVQMFRERAMSELRWVNRISGMVIIGFGLLAFFK